MPYLQNFIPCVVRACFATQSVVQCVRSFAPFEWDVVVDTRSPSEFTEDHPPFPHVYNWSVLCDEERARVGTLYKADPFEARKIGAGLIAQRIAHILQEHGDTLSRHHRILVYCRRGGQRSSSLAHVLGQIGYPTVGVLERGYKTYRRHVIDQLNNTATYSRLRVIGGMTGCAKGELLRAIEANGGQVIDLEHLAAHHGSLLGTLPSHSQPSQRMFESLLWARLLALDPMRPLFVEYESSMIGRIRLPAAFWSAMQEAPQFYISLPMSARIAWIRSQYKHFERDPASLITLLPRLTSLHGSQQVETWITQAQEHKFDVLVESLLALHYDPAYTRAQKRRRWQNPLWGRVDLPWFDSNSMTDAARVILRTEAITTPTTNESI